MGGLHTHPTEESKPASEEPPRELRLPERLFEIYMTPVLQRPSPGGEWGGGMARSDWSRGRGSGKRRRTLRGGCRGKSRRSSRGRISPALEQEPFAAVGAGVCISVSDFGCLM